MNNSHFVMIIMLLALGACASAPKYEAASDIDDYGYYSTKLEEDRYRIQFNGRRSTSLATTRDYALLRAADLTLQEGYDWFQIVDRESETTHSVANRPYSGFRYERAYWVESNCGLLGCTQSVRPTMFTTMEVASSSTRSSVSHTIEIVMGKGPVPRTTGSYYEASAVVKNLKKENE